MGCASIIVDVEKARELITSALKDSVGQQLESVKKTLAHSKDHHAALQGLREQIHANINFLLPLLKNGLLATSDVKIVTIGIEPEVRGFILAGSIDSNEVIGSTSQVATTVEAMHKLLGFTEKLLAFHADNIGNMGTIDITNTEVTSAIEVATPKVTAIEESACTTPGHVRNNSMEDFWGSDTLTNNAFHATGAFNFDREDSPGSPDSSDSYDSAAGRNRGQFFARKFTRYAVTVAKEAVTAINEDAIWFADTE